MGSLIKKGTDAAKGRLASSEQVTIRIHIGAYSQAIASGCIIWDLLAERIREWIWRGVPKRKTSYIDEQQDRSVQEVRGITTPEFPDIHKLLDAKHKRRATPISSELTMSNQETYILYIHVCCLSGGTTLAKIHNMNY